jgi:hypothetical protein
MDFQVVSARALGFDIAADVNTGVLTPTAAGHQVVVGAGPRRSRWTSGSSLAAGQGRLRGAYAPPDFREVLFRWSSDRAYDAARRRGSSRKDRADHAGCRCRSRRADDADRDPSSAAARSFRP